MKEHEGRRVEKIKTALGGLPAVHANRRSARRAARQQLSGDTSANA
jgi:hypothetical protein